MKVRAAFTRVDIGVCVLSITLLLGTLGMIGSKGRERAKRDVCAYQTREHLGSLFTRALDRDGELPLPRHPGGWFWDIDVDVVNQMLDLGLAKETFYCPSNPTPQKHIDVYWTYNGQWDGRRFALDGSGFIVSGYGYVLQLQNQSRPTIAGSGNKQWVTRLDTPEAATMELVVDATLSQSTATTESGWTFGDVMGGIYSRWGIYDRTNHLSDAEHPWGGTIGFLDGHVAWRPFERMEDRYGNPHFWW